MRTTPSGSRTTYPAYATHIALHGSCRYAYPTSDAAGCCTSGVCTASGRAHSSRPSSAVATCAHAGMVCPMGGQYGKCICAYDTSPSTVDTSPTIHSSLRTRTRKSDRGMPHARGDKKRTHIWIRMTHE